MFTKSHWRAFELVQQEGKTRKQAADIMEVTPLFVAQLLEFMRDKEPILFPDESSVRTLGRHIKVGDRPKLMSYDSNMDSDIQRKW